MTNGYDHEKPAPSKIAAKKADAPKRPAAEIQKERANTR